MKYLHFQIKFKVGDNHTLYEDVVDIHENAHVEEVRERLAEHHIRSTYVETADKDENGRIPINGGEMTAEVVSTNELTKTEFDIINKYIS